MPKTKSLFGWNMVAVLSLGLLGVLGIFLASQTFYTNPNLLLSKYRSMIPLLAAQSKFETVNPNGTRSGWWRNNFQVVNMENATGARKPYQLGTNTGQRFRKYSDWGQAIRDYLQWLYFTNFPVVTNTELFVSELKKRSFFEEPEIIYLAGVKSKML
jgi:hypothetical protein